MIPLHDLRAAASTAVAYLVMASLTASLTRFGGGIAFIWIANALLTARLLTVPRREWMSNVLACALASAIATGFFGLGFLAAVPMAAVNVMESCIAAAILRRFRLPAEPMESLRWLGAFVLATGLIAPGVTAFGAAAIASAAAGGMFSTNLLRWFSGHALGAITFMPIFMLAYRMDVRTQWARWPVARIVESCFLNALVALTCVVVFAQRGMPLLFLPMLPIILATFRIGHFAAASSVVILAVIGGAFTLTGQGPIDIDVGTMGDRMQFLQFYLAASVLTVLPIATDLARRSALFRQLRDSEARYRLLADSSTDIIVNLDVAGRIRFVSPSVRQLGGFSPETLVGTNAEDLVLKLHRADVQRAHIAALRGGGETSCVEYQAVTASGELRWFETRSRSVQDADGRVDGVVGVIRDIEDRKMVEGRLSNEARTDALTGLLNRRAFDSRLKELAATAAPGTHVGCVALFDIDYFKRVNDTFGHAAGDRVIQAFADLAGRSVGRLDSVARIGGEEFALLLKGAGEAEAHVICERLRAATAALEIDDDGRPIRITVSGGVAPLLGGHERQIMRDADRALYVAKNAGRNRFAWAA